MEKIKIHINQLKVILGNNCNLKCAHCGYGNLQKDLSITPDMFDGLASNIYGIDDLVILGVEATLYLDELKMLLDKLREANIQINKIHVMTNGLIYKQELADMVKSFLSYVKKPEESSMQFSLDKFHIAAGLTKDNLIANIEHYQDEIGEICGYYCNTFSRDDWFKLPSGRELFCDSTPLILHGRAANLTEKDFDGINRVGGNAISFCPFDFRTRCEGERNTCNNGQCVHNCAATILILFPDGFIYDDRFKQPINPIADIRTDNLYEKICEYRNKSKPSKTDDYCLIYKDLTDPIWIVQRLLYRYYQLVALVNEATKSFNTSAILSGGKDLKQHIESSEHDLKTKAMIADIDSHRLMLKLMVVIKKQFEEISCYIENFEKIKYHQSETSIKAFCYGLKKYLDDSILLNTQVIKNCTGTDFKSFMKWWNAYEQSNFSELDKMAYHQLNSNEDF